jgi:outer membrane protein assembly factor BamA
MKDFFSHHALCALIITALFSACNGAKFVGEDEQLLTHTKVTSNDATANTSGLSSYIRQKPNTKWFSLLKVPLGIYSMAGRDTTKAINRRLMKWGEAPVIYDADQTMISCSNLTRAMQNRGYLDAKVAPMEISNGKRIQVVYNVTPNTRYTLHSLEYNIEDKQIDSLLRANNALGANLKVGMPFSVDALQEERSAITQLLNNNGYYYFNKEYVAFHVDTCESEHYADVLMHISKFRRNSSDSLCDHPRYTIRNITYGAPPGATLKLRERTLDISTAMRPGSLYSNRDVQRTYNRFARLTSVRSTNISFEEVPDSNQLDAHIRLAQRKPHSIQLQPEGTNTAGDLGAALSITYENRNLFRGSELFSIQVRGAFEAIKGLEGYQSKNYTEFGVESKLSFPEFIFPGVKRSFVRRHNATSELSVSYNMQNRPEFQRRVLSAGWGYRWSNSSRSIRYRYDFVNVNYVSMPWISDTFKKDYLDSPTNRNAILRYNYEDLLIMRTGFGITYNDDKRSLRLFLETAGNTFYTLSNIFNFDKNDNNQYKVADVAFAQYVKFDADYTYLIKLDKRNTLALHSRLGLAIPYGNSNMLPYEKRYFSGGANSVRGWSVRELGPGSYIGKDGRIDFINQTGDIRIDLNAELRTSLFWKFQGAFFVDAGNIWTIRDYKDQPGGKFSITSLYKEMAVAYGIGLRLNFDYFILRLDLGMKAVNPAYTTSDEHYPIFHMKFSRDYALHFAVGMPF